MKWPVALLVLAACGGSSYRIPQSHVEAPRQSIAAAQQQGGLDPRSADRLELAKYELMTANRLAHEGDGRRADLMYLRADTDARIAAASAQGQKASAETARIQSDAMRIQQQVRDLIGGGS